MPDFQPSTEICGLLNVDKPRGVSSRVVVDRVEQTAGKTKAGKVKVGHAGTLDPIASGVLVICLGTATRLIEYVQQMPKAYRATFLLGQSSPSCDIETEITKLVDAPRPTRAEIERAAANFHGEIEQRPPAFSAVKIGGQRAYKRARRGEDVEMPLRTVRIDTIDVVTYDAPRLVLDIRCGSGTYIRSLGRDLAESLGTAAVMSELVRTGIGDFTLREATRLDDLNPETLDDYLLPPLRAVADLPRVRLDRGEIEEIRHGRTIARSDEIAVAESGQLAAVDEQDRLVALLVPRAANKLGPKCNFVR
ncbi:MAG: tRNA pseudouridine(55) synthase TruB [Planctomycetota bacterium]|nr:MAG: tRNA pseudouridine(55) synthase TruB [Planctomycetota bacterium]REK37845.1 MAG: tRNA pseudouridine(55) synthase TruB [Planctomycetota bacterium]